MSHALNRYIRSEMSKVKIRRSNGHASDDLKNLEQMGLLERIGTTGRGIYYQLKERGKRGNNGAKR